ncbi:MAG: NAD(P)-dependent oxidoreductase [Desulfobacterales bacterium]|nr:NAD(P)-dependent oxidoreductase [Desulfobacterales bacterium]
MGTILITGASGFIGKALAPTLAKQHHVICISRKDPDLDLPYVRGNFSAFEDLRQLDRYDFDVVVHLAAVTGGCLERDGILVNVEGTRCLMRYMIDRGCKKFVMASSIAVVGFQSCKFRPLRLPIPDEHPCLDRHGYGMSKYLMEETTKYYQRQNEDVDVINLRLSSIAPDERMPLPAKVCPLQEWSLGRITVMARSDAVQAFKLAAEAPYMPGVRIMNAAGPKAWVADPVAEILRNWWKDDVDVSYFEQPGHEYDSVYDVSRIKEELNFTAKRLP